MISENRFNTNSILRQHLMRDFDELVCELGRARRRRVVLVAWPIVYSVDIPLQFN